MPKITVPKDKRRLIEATDVGQMIDKAKTLQDKAVIALYYIFGVRRNEPLEITKEDIWMDEKWFYLRIKREKVPKKQVLPRVDVLKVDKGTVFLQYIVDLWATRHDGDKLFQYHPKTKTASCYIYNMIKKLNPDIWVHLFRHTRAEKFRSLGFSDVELMAWFGWSDARTPSNYTHPSTRTIEEMGSAIE